MTTTPTAFSGSDAALPEPAPSAPAPVLEAAGEPGDFTADMQENCRRSLARPPRGRRQFGAVSSRAVSSRAGVHLGIGRRGQDLDAEVANDRATRRGAL